MGVYVPEIAALQLLNTQQILRISIYVDRDEIPEESFGERSTVYPGVADLESIVAKELLLDGELQATVPTQATENRSHGDSLRSQSVTRLEVRSTHHTTVDEEGIALTRLSAVSEYSTDDLGIADQTNPPMDNETAPNSPVWEGKEELRPPSDGKMLVLGKPHPIYLAWLMSMHSVDIGQDEGCIAEGSTHTLTEQHGSRRSGLPAFQGKLKEN